MRLLFTIFFSLQLFAQPQTAIKTWYDKINETIYTFYDDQVVKEYFTYNKKDTIFFNPTPIDYPDYSSIWYDDALHLTSNRGGLVYRVEKDTTIRIDARFSIENKVKLVNLSIGTPYFDMGAMGFGEQIIFSPISTRRQKSGNITQLRDFNSHPKLTAPLVFYWGTLFTVLAERK